MAARCLTALVLSVFLSAGNAQAPVDQNWLTSIVEGVMKEYPLGDTFSLAVNIPQGQDPDSLQQVLQEDAADKVEQSVSQGQVYQGTRVVAATQSDAVLKNIQHLTKSSAGNFLLLYSQQSPCGPTCAGTHEDELAGKIGDIVQNWGGYAFVFSDVVSDAAADTSQLSESFKLLSISKLGLDRIFRCYQPDDGAFHCTSCSSGADVTPSCVANTGQDSAAEGEQEVGNDADVEGNIEAGNGLDVGGQPTEPPSSHKGLKGTCKLRRKTNSSRRKKGGTLQKGGKTKSSRRKKGGTLQKGGKTKSSRRKNGGKLQKGSKTKSSRRKNGGKLQKGRKTKSSRRKNGGKLQKGSKTKSSRRKKGGKLQKGSKTKSSRRKNGGKLQKGGKTKSSRRKKGGTLQKGSKTKSPRKRKSTGKRRG